jgi:hypothetical protein
LSKYAFIVTSSIAYFLGLHSILNAFEYYEHKDIDVILVCPYQMKPYYEYVKDKFSFPIKYAAVEEWGDPTIKDEYSRAFAENDNCIWAKFNFMLSIQNDYEAICWMDADMLLLANIQHYFEIAAKTDLLLCPQFVRGGHWIDDYKYFPFKEKPDNLARGMPVINFIVFFSPKHHIDVVNYIWENRCKTNPSEEMYLFNRSLYDLNKIDKVLELPGGLWLASEYFWHDTMLYKGGNGKLALLSPTSDKIMTMHSRYWNRNLTKVEIERHKDSPNIVKNIRHNAGLAETAINLFSYQGKVPFKEVRELSPFYAAQIDGYEGVTY